MDQNYQYLYPEDHHGLSDYAGQLVSRGREDLQGIMGQPPVPMAFPDQLSSISDITASNPYHHPFLMVPCQADAIQDLRLSPVQRSLGYAETGHGRNASFRNDNDLLLGPSTDQDAWNPLRVTGVSQASMPDITQALPKRRRINDSDDGTIHPSEIAFSDAGSQSHTEEPPSDSGYGTKSVATGSVIGSFNKDDTPAVPSHGAHTNARNSISLSEVNFGGNERPLDLLSQVSRAGSNAYPPREKGLEKCSIKNCEWTGKSASDKKKHETRHLKPFKCDQEGCSRIKGFGTINDLNRHRSSVHGLEPKNGEFKKLYKCFGENCLGRDKEWPRLDNFRQHLRRMHGQSSVNDLMEKSDMWYETTKRARQQSPKPSFARPRHGSLPTSAASNPPFHDSISSTSGLGTWARDNIKEQAPEDYAMPTNITKDLNTSTITSELSPLESSTDEPPNSNPVSDVRGRQGSCSNASINTSTRHRRRQSVNSGVYSALSQLPSDAWDDKATKTAIDLIRSLTKQVGVWDECRQLWDKESHFSNSTTPIGEKPRANDDSQKKNDELRRILLDGLRQLGFEPGNLDLFHLETSTDQSNTEHNDQQRTFKCPMPKCGKELDRQCKLTKHMKRHERPYACTFPDCTSRRFGSKNDWKRHENSQHFQLQCWRCHVKSDIFPFAECNSLFYRREKFISHLDRHHKVTEEHKITTFLKTDEIGRNGQSRFWCGFCRKIIALNHRGMDAWNERFNHIDEQHFRHGEKIETWQHPEIHRSDSPVTVDHDDGKDGDYASDVDELIEGDNGRSGGAETAQNVGGSGKQTIQKIGVLPTIKINSEQTDGNDGTAKVKCHRPALRLDTSLPHSIAPQTQKRKFATGPATTSAITRSPSINQEHRDSNQRIVPTNADNPSSAHSGTGSAVSSHTNTTVRPFGPPRTRANTAAALFPTMYAKKQAKKSQSDIFSCCHCSGLMVKSLTDNCVMCGHQTCVFCENCPPPSDTPSK